VCNENLASLGERGRRKEVIDKALVLHKYALVQSLHRQFSEWSP